MKRDARDYMDNHRRFFTSKHRIRKEKYKQYSRCVHILQLYDGCMQETPPYIPKRFREDKYHIRNERELEKIWNRSMSNMSCKYEILEIRKEDFWEEIEKFDLSLREELDGKELSEAVIDEIMKKWKQHCEEDEVKVDKEWRRKLTGIRKGFASDKEELAKKNQHRFSRHSNNSGLQQQQP